MAVISYSRVRLAVRLRAALGQHVFVGHAKVCFLIIYGPGNSRLDYLLDEVTILILGRELAAGWEEALAATNGLVTNGLGGFACGTVAGAIPYRYHGF